MDSLHEMLHILAGKVSWHNEADKIAFDDKMNEHFNPAATPEDNSVEDNAKGERKNPFTSVHNDETVPNGDKDARSEHAEERPVVAKTDAHSQDVPVVAKSDSSE